MTADKLSPTMSEILTREKYELAIAHAMWDYAFMSGDRLMLHKDALLAHDAALRAEVERVTDVAYAHCSRADAREADIERITAHYAGAMELANRKVSLMTELLRRAVPLVAFCAPKDSTLAEDIRKAIHE